MNKHKPFSKQSRQPSWALFFSLLVISLIVFDIFYTYYLFSQTNSLHSAEKFIFGAFSGTITFIIFFAIALAIICVIFLIRKKFNKENILTIFVNSLYICIGICVIFIYGLKYSYEKRNVDNNISLKDRSSDQSLGKNMYAKKMKIAKVIAVSTLQPTLNYKQSDLDLKFLNNYEQWTVNSLRKKLKISLANQGLDPDKYNFKISSKAHFINIKGKKLAIVKLSSMSVNGKIKKTVRMVRIFGFNTKGAATVGCLRASNHDIPLFSGNCGNKVKEVFNVSIYKK